MSPNQKYGYAWGNFIEVKSDWCSAIQSLPLVAFDKKPVFFEPYSLVFACPSTPNERADRCVVRLYKLTCNSLLGLEMEEVDYGCTLSFGRDQSVTDVVYIHPVEPILVAWEDTDGDMLFNIAIYRIAQNDKGVALIPLRRYQSSYPSPGCEWPQADPSFVTDNEQPSKYGTIGRGGKIGNICARRGSRSSTARETISILHTWTNQIYLPE